VEEGGEENWMARMVGAKELRGRASYAT
jgi:hypothetical protein